MLRKIISNLNILILLTVFMIMGLIIGCGDVVWHKHADSCVRESHTPPFTRVINYSDPQLCERVLAPRETLPKRRVRFFYDL